MAGSAGRALNFAGDKPIGAAASAAPSVHSSGAPIALLNLNELATVLTEHYDNADVQTRELVPLVAVYWPA